MYLRITFYGYFVFCQPKSQLQRDFQSLWALGARSLSHGKENYKCLQCQNKCNDGAWHKTAKSYFLKVPKNLDAENLWGRTENQGGGTEALVEAAKIGEDREAVCSQMRCPMIFSFSGFLHHVCSHKKCPCMRFFLSFSPPILFSDKMPNHFSLILMANLSKNQISPFYGQQICAISSNCPAVTCGSSSQRETACGENWEFLHQISNNFQRKFLKAKWRWKEYEDNLIQSFSLTFFIRWHF